MHPTPCIMRLSHLGFYLLPGQYFGTAKGKYLSSGWTCATSTSSPGQPCRRSSVLQIRLASNNNKGWYDWYKRLRVHPKASEKDLKNAYRKRTKVEHPDVDKTPGAKERFQNVSSIVFSTSFPLLQTDHLASCKRLMRTCVMSRKEKSMIERGLLGRMPLQRKLRGRSWTAYGRNGRLRMNFCAMPKTCEQDRPGRQLRQDLQMPLLISSTYAILNRICSAIKGGTAYILVNKRLFLSSRLRCSKRSLGGRSRTYTLPKLVILQY